MDTNMTFNAKWPRHVGFDNSGLHTQVNLIGMLT
jgi:hypothetical protein